MRTLQAELDAAVMVACSRPGERYVSFLHALNQALCARENRGYEVCGPGVPPDLAGHDPQEFGYENFFF